MPSSPCTLSARSWKAAASGHAHVAGPAPEPWCRERLKIRQEIWNTGHKLLTLHHSMNRPLSCLHVLLSYLYHGWITTFFIIHPWCWYNTSTKLELRMSHMKWRTRSNIWLCLGASLLLSIYCVMSWTLFWYETQAWMWIDKERNSQIGWKGNCGNCNQPWGANEYPNGKPDEIFAFLWHY